MFIQRDLNLAILLKKKSSHAQRRKQPKKVHSGLHGKHRKKYRRRAGLTSPLIS